MKHINIAFLNINSKDINIDSMGNLLNSIKLDIICLQNIITNNFNYLKLKLPKFVGYCYSNNVIFIKSKSFNHFTFASEQLDKSNICTRVLALHKHSNQIIRVYCASGGVINTFDPDIVDIVTGNISNNQNFKNINIKSTSSILYRNIIVRKVKTINCEFNAIYVKFKLD